MSGMTKIIITHDAPTIPVYADGGMRRVKTGTSVDVAEAELGYLKRTGITFAAGDESSSDQDPGKSPAEPKKKATRKKKAEQSPAEPKDA